VQEDVHLFLAQVRTAEAAAKRLLGTQLPAAGPIEPLERRVFPLRRVLTSGIPLHVPVPTNVERSAPAVNGDPEKVSNLRLFDRPDWKQVVPVDAAAIIPALRKTISPGSWSEPGVVLEAIHDRLIVRHCTAVLEEIEEFLDELDLWHPHAVIKWSD